MEINALFCIGFSGKSACQGRVVFFGAETPAGVSEAPEAKEEAALDLWFKLGENIEEYIQKNGTYLSNDAVREVRAIYAEIEKTEWLDRLTGGEIAVRKRNAHGSGRFTDLATLRGNINTLVTAMKKLVMRNGQTGSIAEIFDGDPQLINFFEIETRAERTRRNEYDEAWDEINTIPGDVRRRIDLMRNYYSLLKDKAPGLLRNFIQSANFAPDDLEHRENRTMDFIVQAYKRAADKGWAKSDEGLRDKIREINGSLVSGPTLDELTNGSPNLRRLLALGPSRGEIREQIQEIALNLLGIIGDYADRMALSEWNKILAHFESINNAVEKGGASNALVDIISELNNLAARIDFGDNIRGGLEALNKLVEAINSDDMTEVEFTQRAREIVDGLKTEQPSAPIGVGQAAGTIAANLPGGDIPAANPDAPAGKSRVSDQAEAGAAEPQAPSADAARMPTERSGYTPAEIQKNAWDNKEEKPQPDLKDKIYVIHGVSTRLRIRDDEGEVKDHISAGDTNKKIKVLDDVIYTVNIGGESVPFVRAEISGFDNKSRYVGFVGKEYIKLDDTAAAPEVPPAPAAIDSGAAEGAKPVEGAAAPSVAPVEAPEASELPSEAAPVFDEPPDLENINDVATLRGILLRSPYPYIKIPEDEKRALQEEPDRGGAFYMKNKQAVLVIKQEGDIVSFIDKDGAKDNFKPIHSVLSN